MKDLAISTLQALRSWTPWWTAWSWKKCRDFDGCIKGKHKKTSFRKDATTRVSQLLEISCLFFENQRISVWEIQTIQGVGGEWNWSQNQSVRI
jgi:hypothetical protein